MSVVKEGGGGGGGGVREKADLEGRKDKKNKEKK